MASYEKKIELADEALAECWDSTDSEVEQLRSIYNYVRENMSYTGDSDKNDETGRSAALPRGSVTALRILLC